MLLKKSTSALCSSGSLSCTLQASFHVSSITSPNRHSSLAATTATTATTTSLPSPPSSWRTERIRIPVKWIPIHSYVTFNNGSISGPERLEAAKQNDSTPPAWPTTKYPTPYEIFDQSRSAPYSKRTFYQLVKLYHPDTNSHGNHHHDSRPITSLTQATKLERYRLVITANNILSDSTRRRAYDLHGAGWDNLNETSNAHYREADRAWRQASGSAAMNATWEDWERWRQEKDFDQGVKSSGKRQDPLYMSNGWFVLVLAVFVAIGSWGQATRAEVNAVHFVDTRETLSRKISEDMWERRMEKAGLSREDRVLIFLKKREGWGHDGGNDSHLRGPKD